MNYIQPEWPAPKNIKAFTTLKSAWHGVKDHQLADDELRSLLSLPNTPMWVNQTHSTIVLEAKPENKHQIADATFTMNTNCVCVILTADCLPILLCDRSGTQVAAIHAGWRGLLNGIIEETLASLPSPRSELLAWFGPAIGPTKFEVGIEVYDAFTAKHAASFDAFQPTKPGKWLANLYLLAQIRLNQSGVTAIYGGNYCTMTQADLFHSYRREKENAGRMASLIWITD